MRARSMASPKHAAASAWPREASSRAKGVRAPLGEEAIAAAFGPSGLAKEALPLLASALAERGRDPAVARRRARWRRTFARLYGEGLAGAHRIARDLERTCGSAASGGGDDARAVRRGLFLVHTYFALVVKRIAAAVLDARGGVARLGARAGGGRSSERALRNEALRLESGARFLARGVRNFPADDVHDWYIAAWSAPIAELWRRILATLAPFDLSDLAQAQEPGGDLFRRLYLRLVPRSLRHTLGEYYTPGWLADLALARAGFDGRSGVRVLDPACGSGTFLVRCIEAARRHARMHQVPQEDSLRAILADVVGFDVNPLAVLAARANYLLALGALPRGVACIEVPVHLRDSLRARPPRAARGRRDGLAPAGAPASNDEARFDLVVGNPPWVGWESPGGGRGVPRAMWRDHGLFSLDASSARLGGGKKDLSMLFTYVCAGAYLKRSGRLAFVLPQSLFKSRGAGAGFRRFSLPPSPATGHTEEVPLRVLEVHDLADLEPFPGATSKAALALFERDAPMRYPVPYRVWRRAGEGRAPREPARFADVAPWLRPLDHVAEPAQGMTSPWLTAPAAALAVIRSSRPTTRRYRAHEGANTGGLNGCYWLRAEERLDGGRLLVSNLHDAGKTTVPRVRAALEERHVYPLLRGRDVRAFAARPGAALLLVQDPVRRAGLDEERLARDAPATLAYLRRFEPLLRRRASSSVRALMERGPFYSMFAVGAHTLAPYKVCWPEVGRTVEAAVVGPAPLFAGGEARPVVPDHTVVYIACDDEEEAHYLAGLLNAPLAQLVARSLVALHPSPHVVECLPLPGYEGTPAQRDVAQEARRLARGRAGGREGGANLSALEACVARLHDLPAAAWRAVKEALAELDGKGRGASPDACPKPAPE